MTECDSELQRTVTVPLSAAGGRLDSVLAHLFPAYSRTRWVGWIRAQAVQLDGRYPRPRDRVRGGEHVAVNVRLDSQTKAVAQAIDFDILYEDGDLFVIDKPAGLVVHPGAGNQDGTLLNGLLDRDPALATLARAGIVHRLDKETSGVMVVARTLSAQHALIQQLADRTVKRRYLAVVGGAVVAGGRIDAPIGRHRTDRVRMAVTQSGRPAVTHFRVRERFRAHTAIDCLLETGRTHQIRVHMAHVNFPIIGDPLYGGQVKFPPRASAAVRETLRAFRRQALHAETLVFRHPVSAQEICISAPVPADLTDLLAQLRADQQASEDAAR